MRSPDEAQRNPGRDGMAAPDFAALDRSYAQSPGGRAAESNVPRHQALC